jgi:hypothetical protein
VALAGTGRARRILCIATFWNKGAYMAYAFTYAGCVVVVYVWGFLRISSQMKNANDKHGSVSYTFKEDGFEYRSSLSHSETGPQSTVPSRPADPQTQFPRRHPSFVEHSYVDV